MRFRMIFTIAVLATSAALLACPGTLEQPERFRFTDGGEALDAFVPEASSEAADATPFVCPSDTAAFLSTTCGGTCHGASTATQGLDLVTPDVRLRLRGQSSKGDPTILLIDPANVANSAIYRKMKAPPPFGLQMPPSIVLPAAAAECVLAWLEAPIPSDGGADGDSADGALDADAD